MQLAYRMDIKDLFQDDEAVSPVIGVILMVAITVILAAVIGAFVLDIGQNQDPVPQATYDWSQDDTAHTVTLEHTGGDGIEASKVTFEDSSSNIDKTDGKDWSSGTISAGDSIEFDAVEDGESGTISVVWTSDSGDSSQILTDFEYSV